MIKPQGKTSVVEALFCDRRTGEYIDPTHVLIPRKEKVKDWLMLFHKGSEALARDKEIGAEGLRVFLYLISYVDYENKLLVTQADVREALEMRQSAVSRAFRLLVKKGILIESDKIGTVKIYHLSIDFGWKGTVRTLKKKAQDDLNFAYKPSEKAKTSKAS